MSYFFLLLYLDLKSAKEKAEAGARSKQNFLANMSHGKYIKKKYNI